MVAFLLIQTLDSVFSFGGWAGLSLLLHITMMGKLGGVTLCHIGVSASCLFWVLYWDKIYLYIVMNNF